MQRENIRLNTTGIGNLAAGICTEGMQFVARGVTSRGLFLEDPSSNIIFLSYEKYRGPFTVNIPAEAGERLGEITPGVTEALLQEGILDFYDNYLEIVIDRKHPWSPAVYASVPIGNYTNVLQKFGALTRIPGGQESLLASVQVLLRRGIPVGHSERNPYHTHLLRIANSLTNMQQNQFLAEAEWLSGRGKGLTPSGDDLLTGMCLLVNRYARVYPEISVYLDWMGAVLEIMSRRTTHLSGQLFIAAMQGFTDERLIAAFDALMGGGSPDEVLNHVSTWGASSGYDSLAGALLVLVAISDVV